MSKLQQLMNNCKCSVSVEINQHRDYYETVEKWLDDLNTCLKGSKDRIDDEVLKVMIETDTVVYIHFYPNTPIGFDIVLHYDLDKALDVALELLSEKKERINQEK